MNPIRFSSHAQQPLAFRGCSVEGDHRSDTNRRLGTGRARSLAVQKDLRVREVDALYFRFRETTVTTKHLGERITADYDAEGRLAGIQRHSGGAAIPGESRKGFWENSGPPPDGPLLLPSAPRPV